MKKFLMTAIMAMGFGIGTMTVAQNPVTPPPPPVKVCPKTCCDKKDVCKKNCKMETCKASQKDVAEKKDCCKDSAKDGKMKKDCCKGKDGAKKKCDKGTCSKKGESAKTKCDSVKHCDKQKVEPVKK